MYKVTSWAGWPYRWLIEIRKDSNEGKQPQNKTRSPPRHAWMTTLCDPVLTRGHRSAVAVEPDSAVCLSDSGTTIFCISLLWEILCLRELPGKYLPMRRQAFVFMFVRMGMSVSVYMCISRCEYVYG